jgi:acetyltransferase-like isoleucine patch superfamily enzyme
VTNVTNRMVTAVHGRRQVEPDSTADLSLAERLRAAYDASALKDLYGRYVNGESESDAAMRRAIWRALARRFGDGVRIGRGALFVHPETFEIGDGVFVGDQAIVQGRFDGHCEIGSHAWIGPQSYFDARDLVLGDYVGWGPGAKVLGSMHTGRPGDVPIIQTDLEIKPVRIGEWADIGVNAVILPGITIGKGAIVGAGAVVTRDVPPFSVVAGVPANFVRWREGHEARSAKVDGA